MGGRCTSIAQVKWPRILLSKVSSMPAPPPPPVTAHCRSDGTWLVDAVTPLDAYPVRLTDCLVAGARRHPGRTLVAQRGPDGHWVRLSYAQVLESARRIGQALLAQGLSTARPLAILAPNNLRHFQLAMGAMYAGVPYAPLAGDAGRLRQMLDLLTPGAVYDEHDGAASDLLFAAWLATEPDDIDAVNGQINGDTIAKFLFTSGSTGVMTGPKAVITTQRMLCSNQQMLLQTYPCLGAKPPVLVDWLPWSHTFGGSHNIGIVLYNGGTLYIDGGKPVPGGFDTTLSNLREIAPTVHFNVPRGWDLLTTALEQDADLRRTFFARTALLFCAGAALAPAVAERLNRLAAPLRIVSGLGMTETAPGCLFSTGQVDDPGYVGLPAPGVRVKLVPRQDKYEACFAGPHVTPGYWRAPERTRAAFDDEGYYLTGDALRFDDPAQGFLFDGRLADDFKLDSGTWVGTAALRGRVLEHGAPYVLDAVIAGSGRADVAVLAFARMDACRALAPGIEDAAVLTSAQVTAHFAAVLARVNLGARGSAARVARLLVLGEAPDAARGEVTAKGAINHAAALANRAALVDAMYDGSAPGLLRCDPRA
jgi:feruloyl-CoA synthase